MSWTFGNVPKNQDAQQGDGAQVQEGSDLGEVQTDLLGFLSIAGETRVQLVPAWPNDRLPPPTASLLSIASSKGLVAAAGPESLVVASTDTVREAYKSGTSQENGVKSCTPLVTLQIPRVSQVAFSADSGCLVIAAEEGGGLAVYETQALGQGGKDAAFQLATNGISVRALAANPAPEFSHLFALVLAGGELLMADLKERKLVGGSKNGCFAQGVSCVAWSARGKQLVAGFSDGHAAQYDHQGNEKAYIPMPPRSTLPMTGVSWLANDEFLAIYTPVNSDSTDSSYYLISRAKGTKQFTFAKFADPCPAFGSRNPAHHFISRLKSFPPSLEDMLILSSTSGTDIGVFTKSTTPLSNDMGADDMVNTYNATSMANDSRRAQMPMGSGMEDTSPIGMSLDLSSKELLKRPLPSDDMEESATPVPALMILDNEGQLSTWWVMYTDSIRQGTSYPGLTSTSVQTHAPTSTDQITSSSTFGSSAPAQAAKPAFGMSSTPGFGAASALGGKSSPWGSSTAQTGNGAPAPNTATFGSTTPFGASTSGAAFGSASKPGSSPFANSGLTAGNANSTGTSFGGSSATPVFGSSGLGQRKSPWAAGGNSTPSFGQTSTFGAAGGNGAPSFGQTSTFGAVGSAQANFGGAQSSPFEQQSQKGAPKTSPFGAFAAQTGTSPFGAMASTERKPNQTGASGPSEKASSPFASFKNGSANNSSPFGAFGQNTGGSTSQNSLFGAAAESFSNNTFGKPSSQPSLFGKPSAPQTQANSVEADMTDGDGDPQKVETPKIEKSSGFGGFKLVSGFQGDGSAKDDLPQTDKPAGSMFGSAFGNMLGEPSKELTTPNKPGDAAGQEPSATPATPATAPKGSASLFGSKTPDASASQSTDDAPLPPDFTLPTNVKAAKSALADLPLPPEPKIKREEPEDAPLPPDFIPPSKKSNNEEEILPPIAGSPPVDLAADGSSELSPPTSDGEIQDEVDDQDQDEEDDGGSANENEDSGQEDEDFDEEEDDEEWADETAEHSEEEQTLPKVSTGPVSQSSSTPFKFGLASKLPANTNETAKHASPLSSTTPAGLPKMPIFAPPQKESPRSPSPVRTSTTPPTRPPVRHVPNASLVAQPRSSEDTIVTPGKGTRFAKSTSNRSAKPEPAEFEDDDDIKIRALLESAVEPSKLLQPFIAHQDYVGQGTKSGLGGQIETVYRDINSMIDTLGLNARSLQSFVLGHETLKSQSSKTHNDLDDEDDWCLVEIDDLEVLQSGVESDLQGAEIADSTSTAKELTLLYGEALRVRTKAADIRRSLALHADPERRAAARNAPLSTDAEAKRNEVREALEKVHRQLQDAEEQGSVLRAELASAQQASGNATERGPTVEAVTNTIMKMTAMIEQKSGDVDVLEAQIRRLPTGLAGLSLDDSQEDMLRSSVSSLRSSRRGLPVSRSMNALATPAAPRQINRRSVLGGERLGMSGMLGSRFRTPPHTANRSSFILSSPRADVLSQSLISSPDRKKMADVTTDEVRQYNAKAAHRRRVLDALTKTVEQRGTHVVTVGQ